MIDPNAAIPRWTKIVLRSVGVVNASLALLGASFLVDSVRFFLTQHTADPSIPYFRFAFVAMTLINVAFLVVLAVTAIRFIQVRISSINSSYCLAVLALFVYFVTTGV